jgi:aspartyl-tRNA(Asn)/glutamyl-tRNA(Gln) amidotransferase subunit C
MADAVSIDVVRRVAALARLGVTDETATGLVRDLNAILHHMAVLSDVNVGAATPPDEVGQEIRLREDRIGSVPLMLPLEAFAAEMREGFFVVPRLASHEDSEPAG